MLDEFHKKRLTKIYDYRKAIEELSAKWIQIYRLFIQRPLPFRSRIAITLKRKTLFFIPLFRCELGGNKHFAIFLFELAYSNKNNITGDDDVI